jgi:hypothetical protein
MVTAGEMRAYEDNVFFVDASVFGVFTHPLIKGDPAKALAEPNTLVVSARMASKYFGREDPLNKTLRVNDRDFIVTGVMADWPRRSHFVADMLGSMKTFEQVPGMRERFFENWVRHEFYTYLLLKDAEAAPAVEAQLPAFIEKHAAASVKEVAGAKLSSRLQPLTAIHLRSHLQLELAANGDMHVTPSDHRCPILLIACVNSNLAREGGGALQGGRARRSSASAPAVRHLGESFLRSGPGLAALIVVALPVSTPWGARARTRSATAGSCYHPPRNVSGSYPARLGLAAGELADGQGLSGPLRKVLVVDSSASRSS